MDLLNSNQCVDVPSSGRCIQPTIEERLLDRKERLTRDLADVNAALEGLKANPEILKVMCLISKVNY
jgi:hypothetical protein